MEHAALADIYPGMFDSYATDRTEMLEQMLRAAEMGRPEHISLMESAMREGGEDAVTQQMMFFEKFLTDELNNFSKQAGFEVRIKQQEILRNKKLQADTADAFEKQSQRKAMQVAQNRTLKVFQQLRKMRKTESAETQKLIDELVGGFDTFAKSMRGIQKQLTGICGIFMRRSGRMIPISCRTRIWKPNLHGLTKSESEK